MPLMTPPTIRGGEEGIGRWVHGMVVQMGAARIGRMSRDERDHLGIDRIRGIDGMPKQMEEIAREKIIVGVLVTAMLHLMEAIPMNPK